MTWRVNGNLQLRNDLKLGDPHYAGKADGPDACRARARRAGA